MSTAGICGTGLIGASIGLGLRAAGWHVLGWDADADALGVAAARDAVEPVGGFDALTGKGVDLLVIATPPRATVATVASLERDGLTMDVAGVKAPVVAAARLPRLVATHPMAGREVSGPDAASGALFTGATWVVVTDGTSVADLESVESVIHDLGARAVRMTAEEHDSLVAMVSHLPQLVAAALVTEAVQADGALDLAAGSFRDLTRVAASDPALWVEVLRENRSALSGALDALRRRLDEFEAGLAADDPTGLGDMLEEARNARRSLTARVTDVRVALADEPGELAKVGHALQESGVDVRDIQLRHAPHGGGGMLTISVRPGDGERLRTSLVADGLLLAD